MNPIRLFRTAAIASLVFSTALPLEAQTYRGRINLKGEMQDLAKPGSLSFTFRGQVRDAEGYRANVTGGGLFRTPSSDLANTTFSGRLTTYTRTSNRSGVRGRLIRRSVNTKIQVKNGKIVTFPGGRVTLNRPIDGDRNEKQQIRGKGSYRVKI